MFNDKNILEIIKFLINSNNQLEFDFCMELKFIYIDYKLRYTRENLKYIYESSKKISKAFNCYGYDLVLHFDTIDFIVEPNITLKKFNEQYQKSKESYVIETEISACEQMLEIINDGDFEEPLSLFYQKYLPIYYQNILSKTIYNRYKSTLPDEYLDSMVEDAKTLIMDRKGEKA